MPFSKNELTICLGLGLLMSISEPFFLEFSDSTNGAIGFKLFELFCAKLYCYLSKFLFCLDSLPRLKFVGKESRF